MQPNRYLARRRLSNTFALHSHNPDLPFSTLRDFDVASFSAVFKQT